MYPLLVFVALISILTVLLIRNERVLRFRIHIAECAYNYERDLLSAVSCGEIFDISEFNMKRADAIVDKWSYDRMLYSLKPLKVEYWYADDEIDFLYNRIKKN